MFRKKKTKPTTRAEGLEPEEESLELDEPEVEGVDEAEAPAPVIGAHSHFCEVCLQPVAHCGGPCQHPGPQYCSVHHPDPEHRVVDKPIIRMHVKLAE